MNDPRVRFIYNPKTGRGRYEEVGVIDQHFDRDVETTLSVFQNFNRAVYDLLEVAFFPLIESLVIGLTRIIQKLADWFGD